MSLSVLYWRKIKRVYKNFYSKTTLILYVVILVCVLFFISTNIKAVDKNSLDINIPEIALPIQQNDEEFFSSAKKHSSEKIDWTDYEYLLKEKHRSGPGEHGEKYSLSNPEDIKLNDQLVKVNGYFAVVSDHISVNRSIRDIRHPECKLKNYYKDLPTVSVVIPFYNDHLSTLMRSVHSIYNRSPQHLIKEIILVNDYSTKKFLYDELKQYLKEHFNGKARVIDLDKRSGLILARLAGALTATGDVLIFLDSHIEVNTNWLPPLLEPIAEDYRTCTCPFIDVIDWKTYHYRAQDEGARGIFDWNFLYKRIPIRPGDQKSPSDPFPSPVMAGGLFAISTKFFWELGGYDPGLDIWGGEQYELSFKIWLCGGQMFDVPCSRIGHIYRHSPFPNARNGADYVTKNFKRVAEVWLDEYKDYIYNRNPDRFNKVDAGDVSEQLSIKKKLQCKSFKYFLEEVAPDMLARYPYNELTFASGTVESIGDTKNVCFDTLGRGAGNPIGLYPCSSNKVRPHGSQFFRLGYFRDLRRNYDSGICLDASAPKNNEKPRIFSSGCHWQQGNQYFRYDINTKLLKHGKSDNFCVEADGKSKTIFISHCNLSNNNQKWKFGYQNISALNNWDNVGVKIK